MHPKWQGHIVPAGIGDGSTLPRISRGTWEISTSPARLVGADKGRPEKAPTDVEKSDGLVVAKKEGNASGAKELTERRADRGNENDAWKSRTSLPKTRSGSTACQGAAEDAIHIAGASDG